MREDLAGVIRFVGFSSVLSRSSYRGIGGVAVDGEPSAGPRPPPSQIGGGRGPTWRRTRTSRARTSSSNHPAGRAGWRGVEPLSAVQRLSAALPTSHLLCVDGRANEAPDGVFCYGVQHHRCPPGSIVHDLPVREFTTTVDPPQGDGA
jgi:hypothetical protein